MILPNMVAVSAAVQKPAPHPSNRQHEITGIAEPGVIEKTMQSRQKMCMLPPQDRPTAFLYAFMTENA
jgi:hypothetical protein